ncbi:hypothetical protein Q9L58_002072 [Maublancomyces gigas]|uniref:Uncharacterized protein n=1 Tax=Discina gigas TaxID=1032678 RepID=A0ABR3GSC1_9PEZI
MAKKKNKRDRPEVDELLARPWCYYCERDFDDLKILIAHQKAKHYKCERCGRRLNTAGGLRVHMEQVHKEQLEAVDNAIPGRESIDLEIFGTEGIPESEVAAHNQRILSAFAQREADRRAGSGQSGSGTKRQKLDISKDLDPQEIMKKLEAHKKAMAAAAAGGNNTATPGPPGSPGRSASPGQGAYEAQGSPPQGSYQGPPPHIQHPQHPQHPQRHQPPAPSSLPQAHQIPGLPPRPNAPGLPPRPNFTNPGMNNGGFGRGGPVGQAGWNQPPPTHQQQQPAFGGPGTYIPPPSPSQQFGQPQQQQQSFSPHNQQGQQFGFPSHGMQQQFGQPQQQQMQHQQQPQHQYQNGNHGRNDSSASLTATGVEGVKMESPDAGTPEVVASMEKKTEKPKRETRMIYGDNEISPVSHTQRSLCRE